MRMIASAVAVLALILAQALPSAAQEGTAAPDLQGETDVQAQTVLSVACSTLSSLKAYSFTAEVDRDFAYPSGDSVRMSQTIRVSVARPDRFRCEIQGDDRDGAYVYDGKTLTMYDADAGVYGTTAGKGSIDETVRAVVAGFGIQTPLANLLCNEPCGTLDLDKVTGRYLGIHTAAGQDCHHLIFFGEDMNWQIWVGESDGLVRKMVITDKSLPGWPQYTAVMRDWKTAPKFKAGQFTFTAPKGTRQIPVLPLGDAAKPETGKQGG